MGYRWVIALLIFCNNYVSYMLRVNLSVNIVAMVPITNVTYDVTLDWTPYQRAQVLSSYFWGYLVSNLFGGVIASRCSPRLVALVVMAVSALLTILSPPAAKHSYISMLIIRIAMGFCFGFFAPMMSTLIARWAVPNERGKFLGAATAGTIATFVTWSLCGVIIENIGWEWGFYSFGIAALIYCVPWWVYCYDSPERHPKISLEELKYITEGTRHTKNTKHFLPYRRILTSLPVLSLLIAQFGSGWGIYFVITAAPSYLSTALGYKMSATGVLSGVIYLCRSTSSFAFGSLGDFMLQRKLLSVPVLRRLGIMGSHVIPGVLVMCIVIPGCSPNVYVFLIVLALTMNGMVTISSTANTYDLTSNFVGAVSGLAAAVLTSAGIISPFVTAFFTKYNETDPAAWRPVFYLGSMIYILSGLQFVLFCSTKKQPWDRPEKENTENIEIKGIEQ